MTTYTLLGLEEDERYRIRIVAANVRGEGAVSSSVSQYSGAVPSSLDTPTLVAGSRTHDSIGV